MSRQVELRVDVSDAVDIEGHHELAVTVVVPDQVPASPVVLFCAHGGTYTRAYWNFELPAGTSRPPHEYNFSRFLAERGFIVVSWDALGIGESSHPDPWSVTTIEVGQAGHALVSAIVARLADGTLAPDLAPITDVRCVGVGHSLGGLSLIRQQARQHSFERLAVLGWTNVEHPVSTYIRDQELAAQAALDELVAHYPPEEVEQRLHQLREFPQMKLSKQYRVSQRAFFYLDDVPVEVMDADDDLARWRGGAMWLSSRIPAIAHESSAAITVPVLLGYGESDVSVDPRGELAYYLGSRDLTLHIQAGSSHCHNFATTRYEQWQRIGDWAASGRTTF